MSILKDKIKVGFQHHCLKLNALSLQLLFNGGHDKLRLRSLNCDDSLFFVQQTVELPWEDILVKIESRWSLEGVFNCLWELGGMSSSQWDNDIFASRIQGQLMSGNDFIGSLYTNSSMRVKNIWDLIRRWLIICADGLQGLIEKLPISIVLISFSGWKL